MRRGFPWRMCAIATFVALASLHGPARAGWQVNGVKVLDASGGGIVTDGAGGAFIAGTNEVFSNDCGFGVSFGRVDGNGNVLVGGGHGVVVHCESDPYSASSGYAAMLADGRGHALVAYDYSAYYTGSYGQALANVGEDGTLRWPFKYIFLGTIVADGAGGAYVNGGDFSSYSDYKDHLSHYDDAGALAWSREFPLIGGGACDDAHGGVIASWQDDSVRVQRFDPSGAPQWRDGGVRFSDTGFLVSDARGGAWMYRYASDPSTHLTRYYALHLDSTGTVLPPWILAGERVFDADTLTGVRAAADGAGGLLLIAQGLGGDLWVSHALDNGFDPDWGGWQGLKVATTVAGRGGSRFDVAPDGAGGAYVVWQDARGADGKADIYATHLLADGEADPTWTPGGNPVCTAELDQKMPSLMTDGNVTIAMWTDLRLTASGGLPAIYAQRLGIDGVTPAFLSRVAADVESGHVRLQWLAADRALHAAVFRRADGEEWMPLASLVPDIRGVLSFEDDAVSPGGRYGYRLEDSESRVLDELWLDIPPAAALEFRLSPNPSKAGIVAEFSLAEAGPARISVFDVAGRKRADLRLGPLGAGTHTSVVTPSGALEPGIYVVRFDAGGREIVRRVVVTR